MKTKKIVLTALIVLAIAIPFAQAKPRPLGWWEYYTHSETIAQGHGIYHQHKHEGALNGYGYIVSASGDYAFADNWDAPWLYVWITNEDTGSIDVTWRCYFYVN